MHNRALLPDHLRQQFNGCRSQLAFARQRPRCALCILTLLFFSCTASLWAAAEAHAGGVVGSGAPGSCTEAALQAALAGGGLVTFNCGPDPVTITLSSSLAISKTTEIDGGGPAQGGKVTLSGGGSARILFFDVSYLNSASAPVTLTLRNLTLANGYSNRGGALRAVGYNARVRIYNSVFRDNDSTAENKEGGGGAISMHYGALHIEDSLFERNRGINGGAINNLRCPITVLRSTFRDNDSTAGSNASVNFGFGGAIYNDGASRHSGVGNEGIGGEVIIRDSVFVGNQARNHGGAVYTYLYYPDRSTIEGNLFMSNTVYARYGGISANGGALMHHNGPLTLRNSTFVGNRSEQNGGAIRIAQSTTYTAWSTATLVNLTIAYNRADALAANRGSGGGLHVEGGQVTAINLTVAYNHADEFGGGIYNASGSPANAQLRNVIIADNQLGGVHTSAQCFGALSGSPNLQSLSGSDCIPGIARANPLLAAGVANNGGPLPTLALLPGSPAIDAGVNCPPQDQRGVGRFGPCDLGAFEYAPTSAHPPRAFVPLVLR